MGGDDETVAVTFDPRGVRPSSLVFWKALLMHMDANYSWTPTTAIRNEHQYSLIAGGMHIRRKFYVGIAAYTNNTL
jgi:hypothetical protein